MRKWSPSPFWSAEQESLVALARVVLVTGEMRKPGGFESRREQGVAIWSLRSFVRLA